jgi:transcriptional regulator of nitric oxide reductase
MKKHTLFMNLLMVCVLVLTTVGMAGSNPAEAQTADDVDPQATDAMPEPTIVFPGIERPDNPGGDPDVYPVAAPDPLLNDPRLIGAVPDTTTCKRRTRWSPSTGKTGI